jgi:hypothetical protein
MTMLVNKTGGSVWAAIIFHETCNFIAFTIHYPGYYVELFWSLAAVLAIVLLPKPLFVNPWRQTNPETP